MSHEAAAETFVLAAVLALAGGFLDAYSFLERGGVFANAETGNMVLTGVFLLKGQFLRALSYAVPVLAYALGVWTAEVSKIHWQKLCWRQFIVGAEAVVILGVAFMPDTMDMLANVLIAFACGMQVQSFRKVHGNAFATTMCTGNLRSGTENLFKLRQTGDPAAKSKVICYYGIIAVFITGAAIGGLLCEIMGRRAPVVCAGLFVLALILLSVFGKDEQE